MPTASESQSHLAYLCLENLIVTLKLAPGTMVTEKQLIALCDLGRTPVREAIQKLEWQGLIAIRPRAGLQITALNPDHPAMVLQTRRQLEPLAARLMADRITDEARIRLIECAKTMTECAVTGDKASFLAADKDFDDILEAICPNPFLSQALGSLQTHSRRYWFSSATQESLENSVNLHVKVIRALLQGKPDEAEHAMADLIDGLKLL